MEFAPSNEEPPVHLRRSKNKWLQTDFKVVTSEVLLGSIFEIDCRFLVIQDFAGEFLTVALRKTFEELYATIARSRFPGDVPPDELPLGEWLRWRLLDDFYIVNENFATSRPELWLNDLPPRHVLILRERRLTAVVAREDFKFWLESLRCIQRP